jgi:MinD superfamily P-loop ATPase
LIVTEPTVSGRHDMARVAELAEFFRIPAMMVINKFDLNPETGAAMEEFARERGIRPIGRLPFDPAFTRAMVAGQTLFEYGKAPWVEEKVRDTWRGVREWMEAS